MYARPYLRNFRRLQRHLFDSTVRVERPVGGFVQAETSRTLEVETALVYEGPAQFLKPEAMHRQETVGAEPTAISSLQVTVPHDVDARIRDVVTVTGSFDPALVGRTYRVVDVRRSEWLVHRKLWLEETSP